MLESRSGRCLSSRLHGLRRLLKCGVLPVISGQGGAQGGKPVAGFQSSEAIANDRRSSMLTVYRAAPRMAHSVDAAKGTDWDAAGGVRPREPILTQSGIEERPHGGSAHLLLVEGARSAPESALFRPNPFVLRSRLIRRSLGSGR